MSREALLHFKNIKKSFSGNVVLDGVDFEIYPGQVIALAGENGAGKSTLMNILFGMSVIRETGGYEGEIIFEGKPSKYNPLKMRWLSESEWFIRNLCCFPVLRLPATLN